MPPPLSRCHDPNWQLPQTLAFFDDCFAVTGDECVAAETDGVADEFTIGCARQGRREWRVNKKAAQAHGISAVIVRAHQVNSVL